MANTNKQKELLTDWPVDEGLTARTNKLHGRQSNLIPEQDSLILSRLKVGI